MYMKLHKKRISIFILFLIFSLMTAAAFTKKASAETPMAEGIAIDLEIAGKSIPEGSIISLNEGKYMLSSMPYDSSVFGVVTDNPAVSFRDVATARKRPVITMGKALVRVSTINGMIKRGDLITTSVIAGVGQKATENGYVIGIAQADYTQKDPHKIGTIYVTLHLNFGLISMSFRENLMASLRQGARAPFSTPLNAFRYALAGLIAILSFASGFWFFGRVSTRGIEAIGRNPLARRFIILSVFLNVLIAISVLGFGVALAYLILVI